MLSPLLPEDELAPLKGNGGNHAATQDDSQLLRGLLEDGPLPTSGTRAMRSLDLGGLGDGFDEDEAAKTLPLDEAHIDDILRLCIQMKASDTHLSVGIPPMFRIDGKLVPSRYDPVTPRDAQRLVYDILTSEQIERYE